MHSDPDPTDDAVLGPQPVESATSQTDDALAEAPSQLAAAEFPLASSEPTASLAPAAADLPATVAAIPIDTPQWLHPMSPFFDLISHVRSLIIPIGLAFFGAARDEMFWQVIAAVFIFIGLVAQVIHFFTFRFWLTRTDLMTRKGLLFHQTRTIPLRKIQNIDFVQTVLHRLLGVAEARIETAGGTEAEAILRVLSLSKLDHLRSAVHQLAAVPSKNARPIQSELQPFGAESAGKQPDALEPSAPPSTAASPLLTISSARLVAAGLMNDRGIVMVGIALAAAYQFELFETSYFKYAWEHVPWPNNWSSGALIAVAGLVAALLLLRMLSVIWFVTRFFNYQLMQSKDELQVEFGLLTRIRSSIPRQRIQFISVHQNWLMHRLGWATIRIETAGGAATSDENGNSSLTRKWFIPILRRSDVASLMCHLRAGIDFDEEQLIWQGCSPMTRARLMRFAAISSLLTLLLAGIWSLGWAHWWPLVLAAALIPYYFWWAHRKSKSLSLARTDWGVVFRSGILNRKLSVTFFDRIQAVAWIQSPFDRRWRMAGVAVDTAGAGPAEHTVSVSYLDEQVAAAVFAYLKQSTAEHHLRWR